MRNWDELDEHGVCQADKEWEDVVRVVQQLPGSHPPPVEVNFVKEYWGGVFSPFIDGYATGCSTPNPDVACNREIKFGVLLDRALAMPGVDLVATGHYARVVMATPLELDKGQLENHQLRAPGEDVSLLSQFTEAHQRTRPQLWTALDMDKDQSYFLSQVGDFLPHNKNVNTRDTIITMRKSTHY